MLNWERIEQLRDDVGEESLPEVIALFLEESDEAIARLEGETGGRSAEALLHSLKGTALQLGLDRLAELAAQSEAQAGGRAPGTPDLAALLTCYRHSRAAFLDRARAAGLMPR